MENQILNTKMMLTAVDHRDIKAPSISHCRPLKALRSSHQKFLTNRLSTQTSIDENVQTSLLKRNPPTKWRTRGNVVVGVKKTF
jgi:hypothetical protein